MERDVERGLDTRDAASSYRGSQVGTAILLRGGMVQYLEKNYTERTRDTC